MQIKFMVRYANADDALKLSALAIEVWLHTYAIDGISEAIAKYVLTQYSPVKFAELISNTRNQILVAEHNCNIIGYAAITHDMLCPGSSACRTELGTLYIQEHFKRRSVGSQLLSACEHEAGGLWLTVNRNNRVALEFYRAKGFIDIGKTYFELEGKQHENRIMVSPRAELFVQHRG